MSFHKPGTFGKKKQQLALQSKVFSHPARLAILKILAKKESCNCGELVSELPLSQSTVSQHLRELKKSGMIRVTPRKTSSVYSLHAEGLAGFQKDIKKFIKSLVKNGSGKKQGA
jgi:DNA-binding transcriptional ArsR family regulator